MSAQWLVSILCGVSTIVLWVVFVCLIDRDLNLNTIYGKIILAVWLLFGLPLVFSSLFVEYSSKDAFVVHKDYAESWLDPDENDPHRFCYSACANVPDTYKVASFFASGETRKVIQYQYEIQIEPHPIFFDFFVESLPFNDTTPLSVDEVEHILAGQVIKIVAAFQQQYIKDKSKFFSDENEYELPTTKMRFYVELSNFFEPRLTKIGWTIKKVDEIKINQE